MADYMSRHPSPLKGDKWKLEELWQDWFTVNSVSELNTGILNQSASRQKDQPIRAPENSFVHAAAAAPLQRASDWLLSQMRRRRTEDRARAAWALATVGGRVDYSVLNALHRSRTSLSPRGAAYLALAWQAFGRAELAAEAPETAAIRRLSVERCSHRRISVANALSTPVLTSRTAQISKAAAPAM